MFDTSNFFFLENFNQMNLVTNTWHELNHVSISKRFLAATSFVQSQNSAFIFGGAVGGSNLLNEMVRISWNPLITTCLQN